MVAVLHSVLHSGHLPILLTARGGQDCCCQFTDMETEAQTRDVTAQSRLDAECETHIQNQAC